MNARLAGAFLAHRNDFLGLARCFLCFWQRGHDALMLQ